MSGDLKRNWASLRWKRLILAAVFAPLPAVYIGFAAFALAYSSRSLYAVLFRAQETGLYVWGFAVLFTIFYLNLVSRFRGRVGMVECLVVGGVAAFLLASFYFVGSMALGWIGALPAMIFFPGVVIWTREHWSLGSAILGAILAPAGALSGWIFWRLGIAPAPLEDNRDVF